MKETILIQLEIRKCKEGLANNYGCSSFLVLFFQIKQAYKFSLD